MVDPERARVGEGGAQHGDEGRVSRAPQPVGRERGQRPVLPQRPQRIGRGADVEAAQHGIAHCPGVAADLAHPDGKIADEADGHAAFARASLHLLQPLPRQPLREQVEADLAVVLARELAHGVGGGIVEAFGPLLPAVHAFGGEVTVERVEDRMPCQLCIGFGKVRLDAVALVGWQAVPQGAQFRQPQRQGALPVDQRAVLARRQRRQAEQRGIADGGIEKGAAGGRIGAEGMALAREEGVHRVDRHRVAPACRQHLHRLGQFAEIAEAARERTAQRGDLQRGAPGSPPRRIGQRTGGGGNREARCAPIDHDVVITGLCRRDRQPADERQRVAAPVLARRLRQSAGRGPGDRMTGVCHQQCRERGIGPQPLHRMPDGRLVRDIMPQGRQHQRQALVAHHVFMAVHVDPAPRKTRGGSQRVERVGEGSVRHDPVTRVPPATLHAAMHNKTCMRGRKALPRPVSHR